MSSSDVEILDNNAFNFVNTCTHIYGMQYRTEVCRDVEREREWEKFIFPVFIYLTRSHDTCTKSTEERKIGEIKTSSNQIAQYQNWNICCDTTSSSARTFDGFFPPYFDIPLLYFILLYISHDCVYVCGCWLPAKIPKSLNVRSDWIFFVRTNQLDSIIFHLPIQSSVFRQFSSQLMHYFHIFPLQIIPFFFIFVLSPPISMCFYVFFSPLNSNQNQIIRSSTFDSTVTGEKNLIGIFCWYDIEMSGRKSNYHWIVGCEKGCELWKQQVNAPCTIPFDFGSQIEWCQRSICGPSGFMTYI